jgi:uncharacterized protein YdiU (UPF0061 family)
MQNTIGWNFDNSYLNLSKMMASQVSPVPVKDPKIILYNARLAKELGLNFSSLSKDKQALIFSGNILPEGTIPWAEAYAGHQFGHFVMLGDGRAIVLGEHIAPNKQRFDIQLKGSGKTPYSRGGDGRAALGPMLREYIISEAIHYLKIPTTRSLAVVATGQDVMRETILPGAILTRVASSHIRVGTFEFVAAQKDVGALQELIMYCIDRHYPELKGEKIPALQLFRAVMQKHADLIMHYMRIGFIHGVLNTDNVAISGESIDYGPCAFMDAYDPKTKFSSIDHQGRYAYGNQAKIAQWNMARFAETLIPLIDVDLNKSIEILEKEIADFADVYGAKSLDMMRGKLGIQAGDEEEDHFFIKELLDWMHGNKADYTNTFRDLMNENLNSPIYKNEEFQAWYTKFIKKNPDKNIMKQYNPVLIPRNHKVEEALEAAHQNNLDPLHQLLEVLEQPYEENSKVSEYQTPAPTTETPYQTFCGT